MTANAKEKEAAGGAPGAQGGGIEMTPREIKMAELCRKCPLCNYSRKKPETIVGRVMNWHGKYCPSWLALQKLEQKEACACGAES